MTYYTLRLERILLTVLILLMGHSAVEAQTSFKIQIEHEERLPSLAEKFPLGALFDLKEIEIDRRNKWIKIPKNLAGDWSVDSNGIALVKEYSWDSKSKTWNYIGAFRDDLDVGVSFGDQIDRNGDVWEYIGTPCITKKKLGRRIKIQFKQKPDVSASNSERIVYHHTYGTVFVGAKDGKIRETFQNESIQKYTIFIRKMEYVFSIVNFNILGEPESKHLAQGYMVRIKPFEIRDRGYGRNLKYDFVQYLEQSGQKHLIPDSMRMTNE